MPLSPAPFLRDEPVHAVAVLPSKAIQIQSVSHPGDENSGPHIELFALCEDGSIWVQYHSSGFSNVPTDGKWYSCDSASVEERQSHCEECVGEGKIAVMVEKTGGFGFGIIDCPSCSGD